MPEQQGPSDRSQAPSPIPVMRPRLPTAERLLPYLRRIDANRVYANWGPLVTEFEGRVAQRFGLASDAVVSAGSGTAALVGAILATAGRAGRERPIAVVPSFTFVATALAVEQCGYQIHLADVDSRTWTLDAERVEDLVPLERVGLVVPVSPFGRPVPQDPWRSFHDRVRIPVVIDGAASFEGLSAGPGEFIGDVPVTLSFHATKSISTGEGGCVITRNTDLAHHAAQALNFGFDGKRNTAMSSINGKMSEYHAAVGLAELDGWDDKQSALHQVAERYRAAIDAELGRCLILAPDVASVYVLFRCRSESELSALRTRLTDKGVAYRSWYDEGLHRHSYFSSLPHLMPLHVTDELASTLIGLPTAVDLSDADLARVVGALQGEGVAAS